jgi:hypothetical protein
MIKFLRDRRARIAIVSGMVVAGVAVAALTTGFGSVATAASSANAGSTLVPVTLQTVATGRLSQIGLSLYLPTGSTTLTEGQAENAAAAAIPSSGVRESVLAQVVDPTLPQLNGGTFWVESMSDYQAPSAGPPPGVTNRTLSFMLVFISPTTGQFVFGVGGS